MGVTWTPLRFFKHMGKTWAPHQFYMGNKMGPIKILSTITGGHHIGPHQIPLTIIWAQEGPNKKNIVSTSKHIFRLFLQVKILLLAKTKSKNKFTCGNKIKDFILLGKTKKFLLIGKTTTDIFLLAETKPKFKKK